MITSLLPFVIWILRGGDIAKSAKRKSRKSKTVV